MRANFEAPTRGGDRYTHKTLLKTWGSIVRTDLSTLTRAVVQLHRELDLSKLPVPVPFSDYPRVDRDVLTLVHCAIRLRVLAETLTDTRVIRHIVENTPEAYASNVIHFGLRSAPRGMERVWENFLDQRFPMKMAAARLQRLEDMKLEKLAMDKVFPPKS